MKVQTFPKSAPQQRFALKLIVITLLVLFSATTAYAATIFTETFETETVAGTTFSENILSFGLTGDLIVSQFIGFGCCTSDRFIDSGYGDGGTTGSAGKIQITSPGYSFRLQSLDAWTSPNDGNVHVTANVTFKGTLKAGGFISEVIEINPTGFTGNDYEHVSFAGTAFDGADITELEIILSAPADFIAIDNFQFIGVNPTAITFQSLTARPRLLGAGISTLALLALGLLLVARWRRPA